jgi:hypothetical protein
VEPCPVDLAGGDDPDADPCRAADHGAEELLSRGRGDLLRVVQERERPYPRPAEVLVVEEHACDDERTGERAATGLVRTGNEPHPEAAIEREKSLAAASRHAAEDNP